MSTVQAPLKYLWHVKYRDGSGQEQPLDDKSILHPYDPETDFQPSAFRDIDQDDLVVFSLRGLYDTFSVDLRTGLFNINGVEIQLHDQGLVFTEPLQLVYWRQVKLERTGDETNHYVDKYFFGWKTLVDSKSYQRTMGIS